MAVIVTLVLLNLRNPYDCQVCAMSVVSLAEILVLTYVITKALCHSCDSLYFCFRALERTHSALVSFD